jgi:hypothetical protein
VRFVWGLLSGVYTDSALAAESPIPAGSAAVTRALTGLDAATTYYYRVRAYNSLGGAQGTEVSFTTSLPGGQGIQDITALGSPVALITNPTGAGNHDIEVIRDGVTPPVGTTTAMLQYDTWTGGAPRSFEWIGYQFAAPRTFVGLTYQEGLDNEWGGCFETLRVQVKSGGVWTDVQNLSSNPPYVTNNYVHFETYELTFNQVSGDGIRIAGTPTGSDHYMGVGELRVFERTQTNVDPDPGKPTAYTLRQNYPNPFNPRTTISFDLPEDGRVTLKVFSILGEEVATLLDQPLRSGVHEATFDAASLTSGVYLYRIETGQFVHTRKMILMR